MRSNVMPMLRQLAAFTLSRPRIAVPAALGVLFLVFLFSFSFSPFTSGTLLPAMGRAWEIANGSPLNESEEFWGPSRADDWCIDVAAMDNSDTVVCVYAGGAEGSNSYLARVTPDGTIRWQTKLIGRDGDSFPLGDPGGIKLAALPGGDILACGGTGWASRYTGEGELLWHRTFGRLAKAGHASGSDAASVFTAMPLPAPAGSEPGRGPILLGGVKEVPGKGRYRPWLLLLDADGGEDEEIFVPRLIPEARETTAGYRPQEAEALVAPSWFPPGVEAQSSEHAYSMGWRGMRVAALAYDGHGGPGGAPRILAVVRLNEGQVWISSGRGSQKSEPFPDYSWLVEFTPGWEPEVTACFPNTVIDGLGVADRDRFFFGKTMLEAARPYLARLRKGAANVEELPLPFMLHLTGRLWVESVRAAPDGRVAVAYAFPRSLLSRMPHGTVLGLYGPDGSLAMKRVGFSRRTDCVAFSPDGGVAAGGRGAVGHGSQIWLGWVSGGRKQ